MMPCRRVPPSLRFGWPGGCRPDNVVHRAARPTAQVSEASVFEHIRLRGNLLRANMACETNLARDDCRSEVGMSRVSELLKEFGQTLQPIQSAPRDGRTVPVSYTHLTLPTNREV